MVCYSTEEETEVCHTKREEMEVCQTWGEVQGDHLSVDFPGLRERVDSSIDFTDFPSYCKI